jgi:hypothetical protein
VWTTLGHTALHAHLAADHVPTLFCAPLLTELAPFDGSIALIGQVGVVGPVALATARLHHVAGDRVRARADLARAIAIAERTAAAPTVVRCDLLAAELAESDEERRTAAHAVVAESRRLGMRAVEAAALELT